MRTDGSVIRCRLCGSDLCGEDVLYYDDNGVLLGCSFCIRQYYDDRYGDFIRSLHGKLVCEGE